MASILQRALTQSEIFQQIGRGANGDLAAMGSALRNLATGGGYRTVAGKPHGTLVPNRIGEIAFDTTNLNFYRAYGLTAATWGMLGETIGQKCTFFDDFLANAIEGRISSTAGSGTSNAAATIVANAIGGHITVKSASDDGTDAANASNLTLDHLNFKANQGGLCMEARVKFDVITNLHCFIGFTDTISTTVELPIFLVAGDIDSTATDACGVCFDTDGTTSDYWFHGGVKADTDTVPAYAATGELAPVADTFTTVRVEVSAAGAVRGFINGIAIGAAVANAVTATVALTPCLVVCNRSAAQKIMTVDYIWAQQNR